MTNTVSKTVSDGYLNACIQIESSGNPTIKASTSSALGLGQFLNATWLTTVQRHAPAVMKGKTQAQVLAMRTDPSFSIEMLARFTEDNQAIVGMNCTDGDLYLAHFLGAGDAKKVYRAAPGANVITTLGTNGPRVSKANPTVVKAKTTCAQLRAWAQKRIDQSQGHNWLAKYYRPLSPAVGIISTPSVSGATRDLPEGFRGDVELYDTQVQLRSMNYATSKLDGLWGSKTAGDIAGFINDRGGFMAAPTSLDQYKVTKAALQSEIDKAEAEHFVRPVTQDRKTEDPKTVAAIAPEVVPAKKGMWASISSALVAFFFAIWDTVVNWSATVWNFFTANKDNIPVSVTDPSVVKSVFASVPPGLWLFGLTLLLGFIGYKSWQSVKKINTSVATGER